MLVGVVLALGSAFTHAGWNTIVARISSGGLPALWAYSSGAMTLILPAAVASVLMSPRDGNLATCLLLAPISTILHTAYAAILQRAYGTVAMSQMYPLSRGLAPVLVALAGAIVVSQRLSSMQVVGVVLMAMAAIVLLGDGSEGERQSTPPRHRAVLWGFGIAIAIASYTIYDGWAVVTMGVDPLTYYCATAAIQLVLLTLLARPRGIRAGIALTRARPRPITALAILVPVSYLCGLFATQYAPLALVAALRSSSLLWAALAATLVLRERFSGQRALATGLAAAAVVLMVLQAH